MAASFPFMQLPKAIRLMVYERIPREVKHVRLHVPSFDEAILVHHFTHTAILATCRQVHSEAIIYIRRTLQHFILEQTPRLFVSDYKSNTVLRTIMHATRLQINALDNNIVGYQLPGFAQYPHFHESQIEEANFRKFIKISARQILPGIRENRRLQAAHRAQHASNPNPPDLELVLPGLRGRLPPARWRNRILSQQRHVLRCWKSLRNNHHAGGGGTSHLLNLVGRCRPSPRRG
ncbi:hypothetical protein DM02DRAFT_613852 [Periconia macrospinosa]|uniref:F-box domain-containing protein n=1 Tax=Periconia macrospinosa TaxID=97972 RepID=A0A2V1DST4_9PLEO|nr:hypothetical protein DM02DRAFT_613852 [Periconia macrospinosa]